MNLSDFYGNNYSAADERRAENLISVFEKTVGSTPRYLFSSPGRAEVLGNHTDHNHGKVIVAAINCDVLCCVSPTSDGKITFYSEGFKPMRLNLDDLAVNTAEYGTSVALIRGVAAKLKEYGYELGGFTACATSDIFRGAGVSSSAAFEVLISEIFNLLYLDSKLTTMQKAVVAQYAENVYFGKPCGILDQSGIALGSLSMLDFNLPEAPITRTLAPLDGYTFVLTNTGGNHAKLTPHYAAIRTEMEAVSEFFGKKVLREVDYRDFIDKIDRLKKVVSDRAILRAFHFYSENLRVELAAKALEEKNAPDFLEQVQKSGDSSLSVLQNCYVSGEVSQPVVLAIEYSRRIVKNGAFRVHGGGFAGSMLGIVANDETEQYVASMKKLFGNENVFAAKVRPSGTCGFEL